ncbi:uncharacterized protein [Prorops nasuta]|uniref:uncharacterized protein n=1 Tax=Prorops nasuta TaxID=863751 RepID=UPI0034CFF161
MNGNDNENVQCNMQQDNSVMVNGEDCFKKLAENGFNNNANGYNDALMRINIYERNFIEDVTSKVTQTCLSIGNMTMDMVLPNTDGLQDDTLSCERIFSELSDGDSCVSTRTQDISFEMDKEKCYCDSYKSKREIFKEELQKAMKFQSLWNELRQHIRSAFNKALKTSHGTDNLELQNNALCLYDMRDTVIQLCKRDPQQLFMRLVSQAQEFVVEVKVRLLAVLHERSGNNFALIFLTGFLGDYNALISTGVQISELVKPLTEHLCIFSLGWDFFIKKLYQIYVYSDPIVQTNLSAFIAQLRDVLPLNGGKYQNLIQRYLAFDDEMTKMSNLWPETELWVDKLNTKQSVGMTKLRELREAWKIYTNARKLMEQKISNETQDDNERCSELQSVKGLQNQEKAELSEADSIFDFNFDSANMSPSIELVQILLGDECNMQHQKLAEIVVALASTEMESKENDSIEFKTENHIAQFALNAVRKQNKKDLKIDTNAEDKKHCECNDIHKTSFSPMKENDLLESNQVGCNLSDFPTAPVSLNLDIDLDSNIDQLEKETLNNANTDSTFCKIENQPCTCVYQHARDIIERKREFFENPPCPCLLNSNRKSANCPCLTKSKPEINAVTKSESILEKLDKNEANTILESDKTSSKIHCAQTKTRHSTTQTINISNNHNVQKGTMHSQSQGSISPDTVTSKVLSNKSHSYNRHAQHACHKQGNLEQIKRVSCSDLSSPDGDCSDTGSSQDDSCSTSSSAQRDSNRHCDCCYCEVFGHGVPSVAPVSRNYNEMRERLRQLLTKKKARKCKASCSPPKSPVKPILSSVDSEIKTMSNNPTPKSDTFLSVSTIPQQDERNLAELVDFIEGNQSAKKNNKKAEKKARQRQRKLEEKLQKDKQEADRLKLIELQKKTPEVTITVVDPQKPVPQKLLPRYNLPEISILPTSSTITAIPSSKILNNKKKDRQVVINNSNSISNNNNISASAGSNIKQSSKVKSSNNKINGKNKMNMSNDKHVKTTSSSQQNKISTKEEKNSLNKTQKSSTMIALENIKNSAIRVLVEKKLTNGLDETVLTKKERKKVRREMRKIEEAKEKEEKIKQLENQPQIVTIKRVMESNTSEPTVTITLKGQTPAEDKVLFTLINGQTKELPQKSEPEKNQSSNNKKKKGKVNLNLEKATNTKENKVSRSSNERQQQQQRNKEIEDKNLRQANGNDKTKFTKQTDNKKTQQHNAAEMKTIKLKKDKKNMDNKENIQQNTVNKEKPQQQNNNNNNNNKNKKNKIMNTGPQGSDSQKGHSGVDINQEVNNKKTKNQRDKMGQLESNKIDKSDIAKNSVKIVKSNSQKNQIKVAPKITKQTIPSDVSRSNIERRSSPTLSSQLKEIANSKISIENLKLPPGITITKVDAPVKPLPIKSTSMSKSPNPPKQTTIIATPMNANQSNYASPQTGGNVIVVDTGKLKQDLLPKTEKNATKDTQHSQPIDGKKKKKKKNKNVGNSGNGNKLVNSSSMQNNDHSVSDRPDEPAKILRNPATNMVTIRNPTFGPMKVSPTQQAAIIKVSEDGMVTIRSPALQQAINAGLTSPTKSDFIVKGDLASAKTTAESPSATVKSPNCILSQSFAELRSRLAPDVTTLPGFANIQISKVTNGQSIPENGINLKGTSVTLTKVRSEPGVEDSQQQAKASSEAVNEGASLSGSGKTKKKKKRNGGVRRSGDDWNLVESVFTPKDIDLEDGDMDDAERELEAFKRFCLQSVPPPRKEKVNLNIKDIVLKKKSSSSPTTNTVIAAK